MPSCRSAWIVALSLVLYPSIAPAVSSDETAHPTRIFQLQGIEAREAVTLLRARLQVRQIAEVRALNAIVVTETEEKIDGAEGLLRERGVLANSIVPHEPVSLERSPDSQFETRLFRIKNLDARAAITVLRAIYAMREIETLDETGELSIRAPVAKLDAAEALLGELEALAR